MSDTIPIGPFSGGLNLLDPGPEELLLCSNARLNDIGYPYKRPGYTGYGSAPEKVNGDVAGTFLWRYYKAGGTKEPIAGAGGVLKKGNDSTGAWTLITLDGVNLSSTNLPYGFVYKDRLYIVEGTNPQRYNGTDSIKTGSFIPVPAGWGIAQSTNAPSGSGLTLLGAYQYKMTIVNGDRGEGPASAVKTITLTGTNNRVTLSTLDSAPASHEASAKKLYRTKANGSVFYLLTTLAAGGTGYVDDIADSALGAELIASHIPPIDSRFAFVGNEERTYWFGRAGVNASLVDVSDVGFPDRILDTDFIAIANNDGDILTGGCSIPGGDVFFKRNSTWLLRGFGTGPIRIGNQIGTVSPLSVVKVPGGCIFLSQEGKVYFATASPILPDKNEIGYKVRPAFEGMSSAALARVVATYRDGLYIIDYDPLGAKGYNNMRLEYDVKRGRWYGPHSNGDKITAAYFSSWDTERDSGELYWIESKAATGSYVYKSTLALQSDNGTRPVFTIQSGRRLFPRQTEKKIYGTRIRGTFSTDASLSAAIIQDDDSRVTAQAVAATASLSPSVGVWGISDWGLADWGGISTAAGLTKGSFVPKARARKPIFEITDGASASSIDIREIELVIEEVLTSK